MGLCLLLLSEAWPSKAGPALWPGFRQAGLGFLAKS
jgi:hypothetical protein